MARREATCEATRERARMFDAFSHRRARCGRGQGIVKRNWCRRRVSCRRRSDASSSTMSRTGVVFATMVVVARAFGFGSANDDDIGVRASAFVRVRADGRGFERGDACSNTTSGYDGDFVFRGFNAYGLLELGAEVANGSFGRDWSRGVGRETVRALLDDAREANMNVIRTWAFSVNHARPLWDASGTYDETLLRGLDFVLHEASERNMFVILALADYWQAHGGVPHFLKTCASSNFDAQRNTGEFTSENDVEMASDREFFDSPRCRAMYRAHVARILSRVNTFNGRTYKDDPTIAAFNLMNEPRCRGCGDALQSWIDDMSATFNELDSGHHMLTVGEEGFYASDTPSERGADDINPALWASTTGQDFVRNHAGPYIHFTTAHIWKDNWAVYSPTVRFDAERFTRRWISAHEADAKTLRKPLVIEEFGSAPGGVRRVVQSNRAEAPPSVFNRMRLARRTRRQEDDVDDYYRAVFSQVARSISRDDGYIRGALFWVLYPESMRSAEVDALDPFAVFPSDGAFAQARRFAAHVVALTSTDTAVEALSSMSSCRNVTRVVE